MTRTFIQTKEFSKNWDRLGFNDDDLRRLELEIMSSIFDSIMTGLNEAINDAQSKKKKLSRRVVTVMPVKEYKAEEVKKIRNSTGMSQKTFASYMGASEKTVEAWEAGINHPSGAASRLLNMMEMDENLTVEFPFVTMEGK